MAASRKQLIKGKKERETKKIHRWSEKRGGMVHVTRKVRPEGYF
jgi:hypothetical protein